MIGVVRIVFLAGWNRPEIRSKKKKAGLGSGQEMK